MNDKKLNILNALLKPETCDIERFVKKSKDNLGDFIDLCEDMNERGQMYSNRDLLEGCDEALLDILKAQAVAQNKKLSAAIELYIEFKPAYPLTFPLAQWFETGLLTYERIHQLYGNDAMALSHGLKEYNDFMLSLYEGDGEFLNNSSSDHSHLLLMDRQKKDHLKRSFLDFIDTFFNTHQPTNSLTVHPCSKSDAVPGMPQQERLNRMLYEIAQLGQNSYQPSALNYFVLSVSYQNYHYLDLFEEKLRLNKNFHSTLSIMLSDVAVRAIDQIKNPLSDSLDCSFATLFLFEIQKLKSTQPTLSSHKPLSFGLPPDPYVINLSDISPAHSHTYNLWALHQMMKTPKSSHPLCHDLMVDFFSELKNAALSPLLPVNANYKNGYNFSAFMIEVEKFLIDQQIENSFVTPKLCAARFKL